MGRITNHMLINMESEREAKKKKVKYICTEYRLSECGFGCACACTCTRIRVRGIRFFPVLFARLTAKEAPGSYRGRTKW